MLEIVASWINLREILLEMIALSAVQSFARLLIHNAILFINTLANRICR